MSNDELLTYMKERFKQQDDKIDGHAKIQNEKIDALIAIVKPIAEWKNRVQWSFEAARYLLGGGSIIGMLSLIWFIFKLLTGKL